MKLTVACAGMGSLPLATGGYAFFLPTDHRVFQSQLRRSSGNASRVLKLATLDVNVCGTTMACWCDCHSRRSSSDQQGGFGRGNVDHHHGRSADAGTVSPRAVPMHLSPSPPPPPREDNPGPKQIVSPLMYQVGRCGERGPAQDVESERPGREPWSHQMLYQLGDLS